MSRPTPCISGRAAPLLNMRAFVSALRCRPLLGAALHLSGALTLWSPSVRTPDAASTPFQPEARAA